VSLGPSGVSGFGASVLNVPYGYASAPAASPSFHPARSARDAAAETLTRFRREPKQDNSSEIPLDHTEAPCKTPGSTQVGMRNAADQRPLTVWEMRDTERRPRRAPLLRVPVRWIGWLGNRAIGKN